METRPAYFRSTLHLLRRCHGASRFARCRTEKTRRPVQSQKIQRPGNLLRQPTREIRARANGTVAVATGPWPVPTQRCCSERPTGPWLQQADTLNSGALGAALFGRVAL